MIEQYGMLVETEIDIIRTHDLPGIKIGKIPCTYKEGNLPGVVQCMEGAEYGEFIADSGACFTVNLEELHFHG